MDPAVEFIFLTAAQKPALQEYINAGNRLKDDGRMSGISIIENGITKYVSSVPLASFSSACFAYLDGSSGLGKTQLAFALQRPVLYIPLGEFFCGSMIFFHCFPLSSFDV